MEKDDVNLSQKIQRKRRDEVCQFCQKRKKQKYQRGE
jgi:hypothetical protein